MKDLILELPNFVPDNFCNHLINKFEADNRKDDGKVWYNNKIIVMPEMKNSTDLRISSLPDWANEDEEIKKYISMAVCEYYKYLEKNFDFKQKLHTFETLLWKQTGDKGYMIQRQRRGSKYAWHFDGGFDTNIFLLILVYLNTLQPNEGGETEFSYGRKVRPERGKIMITPASWTYPHCGNEVRADNKYTLTTVVELEVP